MGIGLLIAILLYIPISMEIKADLEDDVTDTEAYYKGNVTNKVNVRIGAGESNDRLTVDGAAVQLKAGDIVVILGEVMVGSKPWYHVRFELNGEMKEGYATSSYISKTDELITPTPTPELTKEPTKEPTPTLSPTPIAADITDIPAITDSEEKGGFNVIFLIIGILVIIGIATVIIIRKVAGSAEKKEMTSAVRKLQNSKLNAKGNGRAGDDEYGRNVKSFKSHSGKKTPEMKATKTDESNSDFTDRLASGVYVKPGSSNFSDGNNSKYSMEESLKTAASKESEEKQALRLEIDSLREHDIVEHEYFGKGEVFDNSDVKLIEVRFGNDVRFLNKDTLVTKKLLRKSDDMNSRWHM